jgi:hypothetical protein
MRKKRKWGIGVHRRRRMAGQEPAAGAVAVAPAPRGATRPITVVRGPVWGLARRLASSTKTRRGRRVRILGVIGQFGEKKSGLASTSQATVTSEA